VDDYIICPKCERGGAQHVGYDYYECLWRDCSGVGMCGVSFKFHISKAGKIDPNKFKKFRDSIKIKKDICD